MISKQNNLIIEANKRGYNVTSYGQVIGLNGNELKLHINPKGYYSFNIRFGDKNKPTRVFVHKLQAYQKFGNELFNNIEVRHLNGDPLDNSIDNISIGTHSENMLDINEDSRRYKSLIGWKNSKIRTEEERIKIYQALNDGLSYSEIKEIFGIPKGTLSYLKNHSVGYKKYCVKV